MKLLSSSRKDLAGSMLIYLFAEGELFHNFAISNSFLELRSLFYQPRIPYTGLARE